MPDTKKLLLFIVLLSILIRVPYFNCPLFTDEGVYAYQAYLWMEQGINFYKSYFYIMLPGFPLVYALIFKTLGTEPFQIRFFLAFWNAIALIFIYLTAKKLFYEKIALLSAFLYSCFSWLPLIKGNVGKEMFMLLPISISLYFYVLYHENFKTWPLFLAGFFSSLAVVFRQSALPPLACLLIFIYIESPKKFKHILIFLLATSLPIIPCIIFGWASLGIKSFLYSVVFFRVGTCSIFSGYWWYHPLRFFYSIIKTGVTFWLIALILSQKFIKKGFPWYFLIFYLFFSFLGISLGGNWFDHYYVQILPSLCILLGLGGVRIFQSKRKSYIFSILTLWILPFFIYALVALHYNLCLRLPDYSLTPKITDYLEKNSNSTDTIYAFLYSDWSVYFWTQMESPIPYIARDQVLFSPKHTDHFIKMLNSAQRPDYLITYPEEKSINIVRKYCEVPKGIVNKMKKCFSGGFRPFCKQYPIQISLVKSIFKLIPKYYKPVKTLFAKDASVIIWKRE